MLKKILMRHLVALALITGLPALGAETSPAVSPWQLLPFTKADAANPILQPTAASEFDCPLEGRVRWEESHVFNPAAVVREGKVWIVYRAQGKSGVSRLGLASSIDGLHFVRHPKPVVYPDNDSQRAFEAGGGCEDPRIIEDSSGNYVLTYTAYDGKTARLMVATSKDLLTWRKHGPAFQGEMREEWTKSGSIVCRRQDDRFIAEPIDGRYWMYLRDSKFLLATSKDLKNWEVIRDSSGKPREIVSSRRGLFDSDLVEPGPQAWLRDDGILLLYNGVNAKTNGDPKLPPGNFASGQLLMDRKDPTRILKRSDGHFLTPDRPYEITGQVGNVCFIEGMVTFQGRWLLYYGTADSRVAVATGPAVR
jgi:beta-1,2-mannosidase